MTDKLAEPVIFELGSYTLKAGIKSDPKPSVLLKSSYSGSKQYPVFESDDFNSDQNLPLIMYGWVVDWDNIGNLFRLAYQKMGIKEIQERPVLISLHPQRSKDSIHKLTQEMFESLQVPALYYALKPHMNLYGSGYKSGLSVVIGHDVTSWMPIYEGYCINNAVGSNYLAGSMITGRLKKFIQRNNPTITNDRNLGSIKEKCYIVQNYEAEFQLQRAESKQFSIANYGEIILKTELFSAPEVLFKPQLEGLDQFGLPYTIHDTIINCPMDVRKTLQSSIILGGGTAAIPGLQERLKEDLKDLDPELFSTCGINIQDNNSIWKGSVILCNQERFLKNIATKDAYNEIGPTCARYPLL